MRLSEYYHLAVEEAMKIDPRRGAELDLALQRARKAYEKLDAVGQERFDADGLWNPYADSRVLYGDLDLDVESVLWGVPITAAECILGPRMHEVMCSSHSLNHGQVVDACRLLDVPFMCLHQPCDLLGQDFMQRHLDEEGADRLGDLLDALAQLPEYGQATCECNPPEIYVGSRDRRVGRIAVKFAGGTAAPREMYEQLSRSGIGTVVCMHLPESHVEEARKNHVNVVVASHMASDSLGINLLADKYEERGLGIIPCSGYIRVKRN